MYTINTTSQLGLRAKVGVIKAAAIHVAERLLQRLDRAMIQLWESGIFIYFYDRISFRIQSKAEFIFLKL